MLFSRKAAIIGYLKETVYFNMVEVVCYNIDAVKIAVACGVDRIELCTAPLEGGLTPNPGLVEAALKVCGDLPVHAMLRCREGNFIYCSDEKNIMLSDLQWLSKSGVKGIVCGALLEYGNLDIEFLEQIKMEAGKLNLVFHRAIDVCINPIEAMMELIQLNFHGILTSGGAAKAREGWSNIFQLQSKSSGRINIMAGSGIRPNNLEEILVATRVKQIHLSGIPAVRTEDIKDGFKSFSIHSPFTPSVNDLSECVKIMNKYKNKT